MRRHNQSLKSATSKPGAVEFTRPQDAVRRLETLIERIAIEFPNVELLKSSIRRERGAYVLALAIDREGGVDTNLCERISRYLANRIDESLPALGDYSIEVASAGLDRPLLTPAHFARFAGRDARIITHLRITNRVEFTGGIEAADQTKVTLLDRYAGRVEIPYAAIKRANLVYEPAEDLKRR